MIGIDIVSISRIEAILQSSKKQSFLNKILSEDEVLLCKNKTQSICGFFAAKESIAKALKCGIGKQLSFLDIQILKDENNAPYFVLKNKAKDRFDIKNSSLSITHDGGFAIAVSVILP